VIVDVGELLLKPDAQAVVPIIEEGVARDVPPPLL
jgi:hypothetical protein